LKEQVQNREENASITKYRETSQMSYTSPRHQNPTRICPFQLSVPLASPSY